MRRAAPTSVQSGVSCQRLSASLWERPQQDAAWAISSGDHIRLACLAAQAMLSTVLGVEM